MPLDHSGYADPTRVIASWRTRAQRLAALEAMGLEVVIDRDLRRFAEFIRTTEWGCVNPAMDADRHQFSADEALWLRLVSRDGRTVGTQCIRRVQTSNYLDLVRSGELLGPPLPGFRYLPSPKADRQLPLISGVVVLLAGLWIAPDWRRRLTAGGERLVSAFVRFTHAFILDLFRPDWSTALVASKQAKPRLIHDLYGYPHLIEALECEFSNYGLLRTTLIWASAAELEGAPSQPLPQAA